MNKRLFKHSRTIHKWAGYVLALQLLAWLFGGLFMSAMPLHYVHGKHLAQKQLTNPFSHSDYSASVDSIRAAMPTLTQITFGHRLDTPIIVASDQHQTQLFDGRSGQSLSDINEQQVAALAQAHYLGEAQISSIKALAQGPLEIENRPQVWQVEFADWCATTLYFDLHSGEFISVRSTIWRIFDFFWMLHIMDYDERNNFNNPLLIGFALSAVLFALSGIMLLFQNPPWRRRRKV